MFIYPCECLCAYPCAFLHKVSAYSGDPLLAMAKPGLSVFTEAVTYQSSLIVSIPRTLDQGTGCSVPASRKLYGRLKNFS